MFNWKPFTDPVPAVFGSIRKPQLRISTTGRTYLNKAAVEKVSSPSTFNLLVDEEAFAIAIQPLGPGASTPGTYPFVINKDRTVSLPAVAQLLTKKGRMAKPMVLDLAAVPGLELVFTLGVLSPDEAVRFAAAMTSAPPPTPAIDALLRMSEATPADAPPVARESGAAMDALVALCESQELAFGRKELHEWVNGFYALADRDTIVHVIDEFKLAKRPFSKKVLAEAIVAAKERDLLARAGVPEPAPVPQGFGAVDAAMVLKRLPVPAVLSKFTDAQLKAALLACRNAALKDRPIPAAVNNVLSPSAIQRSQFIGWYDALQVELDAASPDGPDLNKEWALLLQAVLDGKGRKAE